MGLLGAQWAGELPCSTPGRQVREKEAQGSLSTCPGSPGRKPGARELVWVVLYQLYQEDERVLEKGPQNPGQNPGLGEACFGTQGLYEMLSWAKEAGRGSWQDWTLPSPPPSFPGLTQIESWHPGSWASLASG